MYVVWYGEFQTPFFVACGTIYFIWLHVYIRNTACAEGFEWRQNNKLEVAEEFYGVRTE